MTEAFLPYGRQSIDASDEQAVIDALRSNYLTTGPTVGRLETAFANLVGAPRAIACANGTAALHLAMAAMDIKPDDLVIVPAITFLATANAARYQGARVLFSDVDPDTGLMRPDDLESAIIRAGSARVRLIAPVHLGGLACDLEAIAGIAGRIDARVLEDACHALGSLGDGPSGNHRIGDCRWSDAACFSAHPVKTFTMGEGGLITTRDDSLATRMTLLRAHGMLRNPAALKNGELGLDANGQTNPWYYEMQELGFNYRATDLQCALGLSQLKRLDHFLSRRSHLVKLYREAFAREGIDHVTIAAPTASASDTGWHLFRVAIDFKAAGRSRAEVMSRLNAQGIGSQVHYIPLHLQPYYRPLHDGAALPGALTYYRHTLSLPLFPDMEDGDVARVVSALKKSLG